MCVWHLILHTSSICPGYSVTLYFCCIPWAYLSWMSAPNPVADWSIVWCHLSSISAFLQALAEFSELCSDAKFLCIFYHSLYFGEIIFADSSISWPSERKVYECILIIHQCPQLYWLRFYSCSDCTTFCGSGFLPWVYEPQGLLSPSLHFLSCKKVYAL